MATGSGAANPNQQRLMQPTEKHNNTAFSTDLCSWCGDPGGCGLCFCAACCSCVQYGRNVEKLGQGATCGGSCCGGGVFYCLMASLGLQCIPQLITRGEVRRMNGMPPAGFTDFLTTWCCAACDLCQVSREIDLRHASSTPGNGVAYTTAPQPQTMSTAQQY